jgi:hypothetical protein
VKKTRTIHRVEVASEAMNTRIVCADARRVDEFLQDVRDGVSSFVEIKGRNDDGERLRLVVKTDTVTRVTIEDSIVEVRE